MQQGGNITNLGISRHTFSCADSEGGGGRGGGGAGVQTPPENIVRGGVLCGCLMGRKGVPKVVLSAPEPKAQVHYCDHMLSVHPSSLTFHIFDFSSETAERNSTKLDSKQDLNILYQVCAFLSNPKNKMASDWLRHFQLLLLNHLTKFKETLLEARSQRSLPCLWVFLSDRKRNKIAAPGLWLAATDLNVLYQVCVFRT